MKVNMEYSLEGQTHTARQYWKHKGNGDVFAVRMVSGEVKEAVGPLDDKDITAARLQAYDFPGEPDHTGWVTKWTKDFRLCLEPYSGDEE